MTAGQKQHGSYLWTMLETKSICAQTVRKYFRAQLNIMVRDCGKHYGKKNHWNWHCIPQINAVGAIKMSSKLRVLGQQNTTKCYFTKELVKDKKIINSALFKIGRREKNSGIK